MTAPSLQAAGDDLLERLAYLSGHFETASTKDLHAVDHLREQLVRALGDDDLAAVRSHFLSIDGSDLFFSEAMAPSQRARLSQLVDRIGQARDREPELRVFARNVPVRSSQFPSSVPAWAAGASVAQTLGPFTGSRWSSLLVRFLPHHAAHCAACPRARPIPPSCSTRESARGGGLAAGATRATYELAPDSIWINARLFAANATPGSFVGLKIRGGVLTLSAAPHIVDGKWTLATTTRASLSLDFDPAISTESDDGSPFGIDARRGTVQLPNRFAFHFTGNTAVIDEIGGDIGRRAYGQTTSFRWSPRAHPAFEPLINRLLIPLDCNERRVEIAECRSTLDTFAGSADIERSAWALPVAQIDIARPSPAAGIGGLATRCGKGLTVQWQGLQGGAVRLSNPWLLCDPGRST